MRTRLMSLTESALLVAVATLLSLVSFHMPQGGSVTICSTLPLVLIGYRHGWKTGLPAAFLYAVIQLLLGLGNVSYAATLPVALVIVLCDYLLPYTGFASAALFCRKQPQGRYLCLSLLVGTAVRFVCHVISGYVVWSAWAGGEWLTSLCETLGVPAATPLYFLLYSVGYNSFVFVDMAIAVAVALALSALLDLSRPGLPRPRRR